MTNNLQQQLYAQKCSKLLQSKRTYNAIIHWNLLYALKIWNRSLKAILEGQGWQTTLFNTLCWF